MPERPRRHRHRRDPIPAAQALKRFRRGAGGSAPSAPAVAAARAWAAVVGEAAAGHSVPIRCTRAGVVTVACADAAWAHELSARREQLTARLIAECPDAGIVALRFAIADHALLPPTEGPARPAPPTPTPAQRARAADAAAPVSDPVLRDLIARAVAASSARQSRPPFR